MYYSTIGLLAVLVLLIVNQDILFHPKVSFDKPAWSVYRKFLFAVLTYYITDILWGIIESHKLAVPLFVDTTIYFVAMAVGVSYWAEYTVTYLEEKNTFGKILFYAGRIFAVVIAVFVVINIFVPVLFVVDEDCVYHDLPVRDALLVCQILMLLFISVYAFTSMIKLDRKEIKHSRFRILGLFGLIMAVLLFIQLFFPYLPVYSIGYMLGTCMLHTFVANDEKEARKREREENKKVTELRERFVSLLDNMPGMSFTKDAKTGVYLACNQAFAEYAQKGSPSKVVGLTDEEIFDHETAAHFVKDDRIALSLTKPYIFYEDVPDAAGNQRQLQTTKLKYTDTSGRLCVLGMCQDVTDMVRIQHEHAMTQEAYDKAVSSGLIYTNIAQTLSRDYIDMYYVNVDTEEFVEYQKGEGNGTLTEVRRGWHFFSDCKLELAESVYDKDRESFLQAMKRKNLMKALEQKDTFVMTYRQIKRENPVYVSMKISRMDDEKYIIMGITNVDAEMRETIAKDEALINALSSAEQANKAKLSFLSGMSHEIRTPINAIIGLDTLALKNEEVDDKTREYLEKIGESAGNLLELINDILDMSRIESGRVILNKVEFSFNSVLEQINTTVMSQCKEKGLSYECHVLSQLDNSYYGDDMKLKEMLLNILSNAVKYTESPGSITMTIEKTDESEDQSTICFRIKDTGIGMDKDQVSKIFNLISKEASDSDMENEESGSSASHGSAGLGMAITKRIVEMMDGSINVEFEKGVGTEFIVTLSLQNCEQGNHSLESSVDLSVLNVLVVDDNPIETEHARMILEEAGIKVDTCTSGQEALQKIERQNSLHNPYNLVFMDWLMPGMNGMETSAEIDRRYAGKCTVVALTANNWDDIQEEARSVGVKDFLIKPLYSSNIIENIEHIARRSNMNIFKEKKKAKLTGRRILLAEDVDINAEILMDSLEFESIKADRAVNGIEAVELFEKSTAGIYAAILMDVRMPQMDGLEAAKEIRSMDREDAKKIPIIALTANAFDEDVQLSMQAGMNAHLTKPIEMDNLLKVLGELIYEAEN